MTGSSSHVRVGILLSGRGSNFLALHAAMERGEIPAEVAIVASNNRSSRGLAKAKELGLRTMCCPDADFATCEDRDGALVEAFRAAEVEWVCLAGYMRLLTPLFVAAFPRRVLNIHPSLLPAFSGLHAQRQALEHGVKVSGCTVHLVDDGLDSGPIVVQRAVPVVEGDHEDTLTARILVEEHLSYPEALRRLVTESWRVDGRRVVFGG